MGHEIYLVKKGNFFKQDLPISLEEFKTCTNISNDLKYDEKEKGLFLFNKSKQIYQPIFWYFSSTNIRIKSRILFDWKMDKGIKIAQQIADYFGALLVDDEGFIYHFKLNPDEIPLFIDDIYGKTQEEIQMIIAHQKEELIIKRTKKWWQFWN